LGESLFYNDPFMWDHLTKEYEKQKQGKIRLTLKIGHYLRLARIKKMIERHESFIVWWIQFIVNHSRGKVTNFKIVFGLKHSWQ
jgi:hypothetical protein